MSKMSTATDTIVLYSKSHNPTFNIDFMKPDEQYVDEMLTKYEKDGRRFINSREQSYI